MTCELERHSQFHNTGCTEIFTFKLLIQATIQHLNFTKRNQGIVSTFNIWSLFLGFEKTNEFNSRHTFGKQISCIKAKL